MVGAGLMLAHQVAGKAVRDSFFLTNHPASDLPKMVMAAAAVSFVLVILFSRIMRRVGPRRAVPAGFLLSALGHFVEYSVGRGAPGSWSIVIYFHIVGLGAILLSGFWSQMAESFDPRTAKQVFGRITGAGTLGGIAGGILAERIAALFSSGKVLLLLAILHFCCAVILGSLRCVSQAASPAEPSEQVSPRELFRRAPYLWLIAVVVLGGAASAAVLDYLFKAGAGAAFGRGAPLLRFFAIFYTSTQILTFLAQTFLARLSLQRVGIGRTIASLPLGVATGTMGALLVPAFPVLTALRSFELVLRGSLFRSAYELLYTPIPPAEKRTAKTLLDVACDRAGDAVGSAIVALFLWFGVPFFSSALLGVTLGIAALVFWVSLRLEKAYAGLVQQRLVDRAVQLDLADIQDSTTLSVIASAAAVPLVAPPPPARPAPPPPRPAALVPRSPDAILDSFRELRSEDAGRIQTALQGIDRPNPAIAAQLIRLLAWDEVSAAVRQTLLRDPVLFTGLLIDYLTNEQEVEFGIRRRIPQILAHCDSQLAVYGLLAG
ncbi:MAG TPA: MFS transporter, partial [Bryobacteraceae bacterium]|nr:MFS transporter [Bryobacteraceae bacterium]